MAYSQTLQIWEAPLNKFVFPYTGISITIILQGSMFTIEISVPI